MAREEAVMAWVALAVAGAALVVSGVLMQAQRSVFG